MPGSFKVLSANVDGLESALASAFFRHPSIASADVLCLQETRSGKTAEIGTALGYHVVAADRTIVDGASKHGGVAIFSRHPISRCTEPKHDGPLHQRGQYVACSVGPLRLASVYVTLDYRDEQFTAFSDQFLGDHGEGLSLIAGDFNVFRDARDSWRFAEAFRRREPGCNDRAMEWFNGLFSTGWVDVLEQEMATRPLYTWWSSQRLFSEEKGTRLDYLLAPRTLAALAVTGSGHVESTQRRGGHAQISAEFVIPESV